MPHARLLGWAACLTLLLTSTALGQDEGGGDGARSWFAMFFMSDDLIGMLITWFLVLMSVFSIGFTLMLMMQYRRSMLLPEETRQEILTLIGDKKYRDAIEFAQNDPSYLGRITSAALGEASNGYGAMERAIEEASDVETTRYLRPVEYLNVMGNIGPMIGLFGTVYGMILAFEALVQAGGAPDPGELAGGISTALITTFWGLVVAIPALAAYSVIRNKIDALTSEGILVAEDLISAFKPGAAKKAAATAGGESGGQPRPRATPKPEG